MFDFNLIKKGADDISVELKKIRTEIESKKREREDLLTLPIPRTEFYDRLLSWVDVKGEEYRQALSNTQPFRGLIHNPALDMDAQPNIHILTLNGSGGSNQVQELALFTILKGPIIDGIKQLVDGMDYPKEVGPHSSQRKPLIDKLDADIKTLEAKEQEIMANIQKALGPVLR